MVKVLEAEHGRVMPVTTIDIDAIIDVRAMLRGQGTREAVRRLKTAGFVPFEPDRETVYRFTRDDDIVDVLVPDGLGDRADIVTEPPATTFRTPGGSRALQQRRSAAHHEWQRYASACPCPISGARSVIKARAATNARTSRSKHQRDLARSTRARRTPIRPARSSDHDGATAPASAPCSDRDGSRRVVRVARRFGYRRPDAHDHHRLIPEATLMRKTLADRATPGSASGRARWNFGNATGSLGRSGRYGGAHQASPLTDSGDANRSIRGPRVR